MTSEKKNLLVDLKKICILLTLLIITVFSNAGYAQSPIKKPPSDYIINKIDGAPAVLVPAGEFVMGCNYPVNEQCYDDETPAHRVYLSAFYIYKFLVTNQLYRKCVESKACILPSWSTWYNDPVKYNEPVVGVTWTQAAMYCKWAGGSLPTEAEWEKAARGIDERPYPWGKKWDCLNVCSGVCQYIDTPCSITAHLSGTSPYGAVDMSGNVWEWISDWYSAGYYTQSTYKDPAGPAQGIFKVIRGGSWSSYSTRDLHTYYRAMDYPSDADQVMGFRCVLPADSQDRK